MKRLLTAALLCAALALLSGCGKSGSIYSNYREIEQLQLIQTLGIDRDGEGVVLTASSGRSLDGDSSAVLSRRGDSMNDAMESLQDFASKEELFFGHVKYILIGREAAAAGIEGALDWLERAPQMRLNITLLVVKNCSAKELITGASQGSADIAETLATLVRDAETDGESFPYSCRDAVKALSLRGAALVGAIAAEKEKGSVYGTETGLTPVPEGFAALRDGKLAGFLDRDAARGANLLAGKTGTSPILLPGGVTVTLDSGGAEARGVWGEDGSLLAVEIKSKVEAGIMEFARGDGDVTLAGLNDALAGREAEWITEALSLSRELGEDFLDIGEQLRRADAARFDALGDAWPACLTAAELRVETEASVERSYDLGAPAEVDGTDES